MELSEENDILTVLISREGVLPVASGSVMFCVFDRYKQCSYTEK